MKLIEAKAGYFVFQLAAEDRALLTHVLKCFPAGTGPVSPLTKCGEGEAFAEAQRLLEASLVEQRAAQKRLVDAFLGEQGRFVERPRGYRLRVTRTEMDWLLQVLNEVRVGLWTRLGRPEELHPFLAGEHATEAMTALICGELISLLVAVLGHGAKLLVPAVLDEELWFPSARNAVKRGPEAGLVAVGGDLSVPRLLLAYRSGLYPWTVDPITWWSPNPRGIFELDAFHVPRSLARTLKKGAYEVTFDRAFREVITACATTPRPGSWIAPEFVAAYTALHEAGHAHSVECWRAGELVGGLYGVAVGGLFAGESMFHRADDASKVALARLVPRLREQGFTLFDTQMVTPVTRQLGATEISRAAYLRRLAAAVEVVAKF